MNAKHEVCERDRWKNATFCEWQYCSDDAAKFIIIIIIVVVVIIIHFIHTKLSPQLSITLHSIFIISKKPLKCQIKYVKTSKVNR